MKTGERQNNKDKNQNRNKSQNDFNKGNDFKSSAMANAFQKAFNNIK